jgi:hypothetical protein
MRVLGDELASRGYAFAPAGPMRAALLHLGPLSDWDAFAESWNDLALDAYLADRGRCRRRRYAVFAAYSARPHEDRRIVQEPHQPHYQSTEYNKLQGGIERWFEPILPRTCETASLHTILHFAHELFGTLVPAVRKWHIEVHQFRIEASLDKPGQPTPEGVHRDGVDYVLVLMVARTNIAQGTTTIHAPDGKLLGSFTLSAAFDAALVDDARVFHGVTPVEPIDATAAACRDVLVVTFRRSAS